MNLLTGQTHRHPATLCWISLRMPAVDPIMILLWLQTRWKIHWRTHLRDREKKRGDQSRPSTQYVRCAYRTIWSARAIRPLRMRMHGRGRRANFTLFIFLLESSPMYIPPYRPLSPLAANARRNTSQPVPCNASNHFSRITIKSSLDDEIERAT